MKKLIIISFLLLVGGYGFGQSDTLTLNGKYQGKNLYFSNPYHETDKSIYCAQQVLVNDKILLDEAELQSNAIEIPLSKLTLKNGADVELKIIHHKNCLVKILNPVVH